MPFANPDQAFVHSAVGGRTEPKLPNAAAFTNVLFVAAFADRPIACDEQHANCNQLDGVQMALAQILEVACNPGCGKGGKLADLGAFTCRRRRDQPDR